MEGGGAIDRGRGSMTYSIPSSEAYDGGRRCVLRGLSPAMLSLLVDDIDVGDDGDVDSARCQ